MTMQTHYFEYNESHKMPALPVQIHNCAYHHVSYRQCKVFGFGHIVGLSLLTVSKPFFSSCSAVRNVPFAHLS